MKLPDTNVLVYSLQPGSPHHETAVRWLDTTLGGDETVAFAASALIGFVRIVTLPGLRIGGALVKALDQLDEWVAQPNAKLVHPGPRHFPLLRELLMHAGSVGNLASDAHLAALAIEHGATISSFDSDFHRFPGVQFEYLRS